MKKIAIIFGGDSYENEISTITAFFVNNACFLRYKIYPIFIKNNEFFLCKNSINLEKIAIFSKKDFTPVLFCKKGFVYYGTKKKVELDCVVNCCHGGDGENGALAGLFSCLTIPHTAADVFGSALFMDKGYTKVFLQENGLPYLPYRILKGELNESIGAELGYPLIVKPARLGSSIGIGLASDTDKLRENYVFATHFDDKILVEKALTNFCELNCAAYLLSGEVIVSEVEEINNRSAVYDFGTKYLHDDAERSIPPRTVPEFFVNKAMEYTKIIYEQADLKGVIRVDYLFDRDEERLFVNEINVIPGSLAFYLFQKKGIPFVKLVSDMIEEGIRRNEADQKEIPIPKDSMLLHMSEKDLGMGIKK